MALNGQTPAEQLASEPGTLPAANKAASEQLPFPDEQVGARELTRCESALLFDVRPHLSLGWHGAVL
jgi:hypothetical protein